MNGYLTTILFDLRRRLNHVPIADHEGQASLHDNIGAWLREIGDTVERQQWIELFSLEIRLAVPGLHADYCRAAVMAWMDRQHEANT